MKLFSFTENDYYLSLDRTDWKWEKINFNWSRLLFIKVQRSKNRLPRDSVKRHWPRGKRIGG
jgi:hypothetical protein